MKKMILKVEDLEERIAPGVVALMVDGAAGDNAATDSHAPTDAGAAADARPETAGVIESGSVSHGRAP